MAAMKRLDFGDLPTLSAFRRHVMSYRDEDDRPVVDAPPNVYPMELVGKEQEWAQDVIDADDIVATQRVTPQGKLRIVLGDVPSLYRFVRGLMKLDAEFSEEERQRLQDSPQNLASSIMSTLGYEWI